MRFRLRRNIFNRDRVLQCFIGSIQTTKIIKRVRALVSKKNLSTKQTEPTSDSSSQASDLDSGTAAATCS